MEAFESWVSQTLQKHWPLPQPSESEIEEITASVQRRLEQRKRRGKALTVFQQGLLALVMLVLIALMGWLTDRYVRSAGPRKPVIVTVVVTQIVRREATRVVTATPQPPTVFPQWTILERQPLPPNASEAEIRMRMIESRGLWHSARIDAVIVQSSPRGYIGPPRIYRNLVWVSQERPGDPAYRHLVISGELGGEPLYAFFRQDQQVYEVDFTSRLSFSYPLSAPNSPFYSVTTPAYLRSFGPDQRGILDGTYLLRLLFPAGLATEDGELRPAGWVQIGRDALVVDKVLDGVAKSRLWVDAQTGIVTGWERLDENDGMMDIETIKVTALELDAPFPDENQLRQVLHLYDPSGLGWQAEKITQYYASPWGGREPFTARVPPPKGFDPSQSHLFFQWDNTVQASNASSPESRQQALSPGEIAEIFTAEGYFLGQAAMGSPWDLVCARSPDGKRIAFSHLSSDQGMETNITEGIHWFSLDKVNEVNNVLPNAVSMGSGFAFSPDSRYLAFWGCGGKEENCGIYIHDTKTLKNRKLMAMNITGELLAWSQDGQYLAIVAGSAMYSDLVVVQVSSGKVAYGSVYSPPEDLKRDWGVDLPTSLPGLENCSEPPAK